MRVIHVENCESCPWVQRYACGGVNVCGETSVTVKRPYSVDRRVTETPEWCPLAEDAVIMVLPETDYNEKPCTIVRYLGHEETCDCAVCDDIRVRVKRSDGHQMVEALRMIASIAHEGGLIGLSEYEALCEVRRLSLKWLDREKRRVLSAESV